MSIVFEIWAFDCNFIINEQPSRPLMIQFQNYNFINDQNSHPLMMGILKKKKKLKMHMHNDTVNYEWSNFIA